MHRPNGHPMAISGGGGGSVGGNLNPTNGGALNSLPKQFVGSMKTLFDIMDDKRTGFVKLTDIEKGWQDDGSKGLPHGVIDSLQKVTPASGLLSFERFCAGLKICLLRNQAERKGRHSISIEKNVKDVTPKPPRPPSAPLLDIENPIPNGQWTANNTAAVRPNNAMQAQRTLSLPQLSPDSELDMISDAIIIPDMYGPPPKPPRSAIVTSTNNGLDKAEIRHALQNWQMGILMNEMDLKDKRKSFPLNPGNRLTTRGTADGGTTDPASSIQPSQSSGNVFQKKVTSKRREPRRHTLQNGIDYNMLKRLKQFEEEKDVLLQGLSAVDQAREWYLKQIANVQDKIKYLGRVGSHTEQWSESHQERLDFQRARVVEINRHLSALADSWERGGFPLHMNLAVHHRQSQHVLRQTSDSVNHLKAQNRQLTDQVGQKSERIAILEREKQSLIRDLVQLQRSREIVLANTISNGASLSDADVVF